MGDSELLLSVSSYDASICSLVLFDSQSAAAAAADYDVLWNLVTNYYTSEESAIFLGRELIDRIYVLQFEMSADDFTCFGSQAIASQTMTLDGVNERFDSALFVVNCR
jgi:hypothetical protein